jgi:hypothetical protein
VRNHRAQLRADVVAAKGRDEKRNCQPGPDGQKHTPALYGRRKTAGKNENGKNRAERELECDRLVDQPQHRGKAPVGRTAGQGTPRRLHERQRDPQRDQCRRSEQVWAGGIQRERNRERQYRDQPRKHHLALRALPPEEQQSHHRGQAEQIDARRHPSHRDGGVEVVPVGSQADDLAGEATPHEAEGVVDGIVGDPVDVDWNDLHREKQYSRRPQQNCDGDAGVKRPAVVAVLNFLDTHQHRPGELVVHRRGQTEIRECSSRQFTQVTL